MKFTILNVKFKISFLPLAVISIMLFLDKSGYSNKMFISIFIHELGHIIAMIFFGINFKEINLNLGTLQIKRDISDNKMEEIFISLFGPFFNLIFFILFYKIDLEFSLINLVYFAINLIPANVFDGGDIFKVILKKFFKSKTVNYVFKTVTIVIIFLIFYFLTRLSLMGDLNISLLIMALSLILSIFIK